MNWGTVKNQMKPVNLRGWSSTGSAPVRLPLEQVKIEGAVSVMTQPKLQWAMHTSVSASGAASELVESRGNNSGKQWPRTYWGLSHQQPLAVLKGATCDHWKKRLKSASPYVKHSLHSRYSRARHSAGEFCHVVTLFGSRLLGFKLFITTVDNVTLLTNPMTILVKALRVEATMPISANIQAENDMHRDGPTLASWPVPIAKLNVQAPSGLST